MSDEPLSEKTVAKIGAVLFLVGFVLVWIAAGLFAGPIGVLAAVGLTLIWWSFRLADG